jgi:hypothetical protein
MRSTCFSVGKNRIIPVLPAFLIYVFFVLVVAAAAQDLPTAKPEAVGLSSERLERIGTTVQRSIDDKRIAGAEIGRASCRERVYENV